MEYIPIPPGYLDGKPPDFLQESNAYQLVGTAVAFLILEVLATGLRGTARYMQKTPFIWSDALMIASLVFNAALCIDFLVVAQYGVGRHIFVVPKQNLVTIAILSNYVGACLYIFAVALPKLAILDLYLHIFMQKLTRGVAYATGVVLIVNMIVCLGVLIGQCHPITELWSPSPGGWCFDSQMLYAWTSVPNMLTDFVMLLLPIPTILRLHASWQVKLGILITFLIGSLGIVTSILRFLEFYDFGWSSGYLDETFAETHIAIWSMVEPGVYHLTACFICFRPLFGWIVYRSPLASLLSRYSSSRASMMEMTANATTENHTTIARGHPFNTKWDENTLASQSRGDSPDGKGLKNHEGGEAIRVDKSFEILQV